MSEELMKENTNEVDNIEADVPAENYSGRYESSNKDQEAVVDQETIIDETDVVGAFEKTDTIENSQDETSSAENNNIAKTTFMKATNKLMRFESKKKIKKVVSTVLSVVIWIVGIALFMLCLSNLYQEIFNPTGYTGFFNIGEAVVASSSMEPELYENDLIFYKQADVHDITPGDTIVYKKDNGNNEEILIVHEVISISDGFVVTKGVNNALPDEAFPTTQIVGRYMFKISKIGSLLNILSAKFAPILIILLILCFFGIKIAFFFVKKKVVISNISTNKENRAAINTFFDI